jgi:hypothetical protein
MLSCATGTCSVLENLRLPEDGRSDYHLINSTTRSNNARLMDVVEKKRPYCRLPTLRRAPRGAVRLKHHRVQWPRAEEFFVRTTKRAVLDCAVEEILLLLGLLRVSCCNRPQLLATIRLACIEK